MEGNPERTDAIYSIGAVARMLGVPAQTLRAWEERYQQIVPARSEGGQRLYSRDQVDQLSFIRNQIAQGLQPADAHRLLAQHHNEAASNPAEQHPNAQASVEAATTVLLAERDPYAAEFAEYFLRTEGYVVRIVLEPAAAATSCATSRRACLSSICSSPVAQVSRCAGRHETTVRYPSSPSPQSTSETRHSPPEPRRSCSNHSTPYSSCRRSAT